MPHKSIKPLANRTYLVVGAAGNLGPIWCSKILEDGGKVVAIGLSSKSDPELLKLRDKVGENLVLVDQDISLPPNSQLEAILNETQISGVVLNAGIDSTPGAGFSDITKFDFDFWVKVLSINVAAVVSTLNKVIPLLTNDASVVFIGSMYALVSPTPSLYSHFNSGAGSIKNPAYGASKAALISICNQYATHFGTQGIRFNLLTLGGIDGQQDIEFKRKFIEKVPLSRMGNSSELGAALTFLLSEQSSYMTGHNLVIDGGFTKW